MGRATSKYRNSLNLDELHTCKLLGLWNCLKTYDKKQSKFTTYLFNYVTWECKKILKERIATHKKDLKIRRAFSNRFEYDHNKMLFELNDSLDKLDEKDRKLYDEYFVANKSLREIGKMNGYSKETARRNINRLKKLIKSLVWPDLGV